MHCWTLRIGSLLLAGALLLTGCGRGESTPTTSITAPPETTPDGSGTKSHSQVTPTSAKPAPKYRLPVVTLETSAGTIKIRLRDDKAPRTVENFLENYLARGLYDDTIFHHVEAGFMIAGGGYAADLQPRTTRAWIRNESNNGLSNKRGTVAMARHPDYPHSATSQFFINLVDNPSLDFRPPAAGEVGDDAYGYCVFGEVIEGMDVVDRIAKAEVQSTEMFPAVPAQPVLLQTARLAH
jgi:cyclophilin family peptidyl-prolyl cis-trans isomerase